MYQAKGEYHMCRTSAALASFLVLALVVGCSGGPKEPEKGGKAEEIAPVCEGVGVATKGSTGTNGAPILLLEENHASRAGQIQQAIALVRLYDQHGLRHIALEGYLRERPEINTDWFARAAQGLGSSGGGRVAVRLLKEGEISCAEFLKLVHGDVVLHAIERASEHSVEIPENATMAPMVYLLKMSERSLRQEHAARLEQLQKDIENLTGEERAKKVKEMFDYILSADPWAQAKAKALQDPDSIRTMTGEQHVALVQEIVKRATSLGVDLEPEERRAMEQYLAFWRVHGRK